MPDGAKRIENEMDHVDDVQHDDLDESVAFMVYVPEGTPTEEDENSILRRAQAKLEEKRKALGIPPESSAAARAAATWREAKQKRDLETLADVLQSGIAPPAPPEKSAADRAYDLRVARLEARIPDSFHGINWKNLGGLRSPDDQRASLSCVWRGTDRLTGAEAVALARAELKDATKAVLLGETRAGKSCLASAYTDGMLALGEERVLWMSARDYTPGDEYRVVAARTLILDGIGEELYGAAEHSVAAATRAAPIAALIGVLAQLRGKKLFVTTALPQERMARFYGGNVAARVYEGAVVLRIGDPPTRSPSRP